MAADSKLKTYATVGGAVDKLRAEFLAHATELAELPEVTDLTIWLRSQLFVVVFATLAVLLAALQLFVVVFATSAVLSIIPFFLLPCRTNSLLEEGDDDDGAALA